MPAPRVRGWCHDSMRCMSLLKKLHVTRGHLFQHEGLRMARGLLPHDEALLRVIN